ncbi:MAG TPA: hypothetical protein VJB36_07300 [Methylomirabilota bacterium]|nr:hypothetical protein [Methylomirabilota bacterium]
MAQLFDRVAPAEAPGPAFSAGAAIGKTFSVWARNFVPFTLVALAIEAPLIALTAVHGAEEFPVGWRYLVSFGENLLGLVTTGALTYGVLQALRGERPGVGPMLAVGARRLGWLFLVSLGVGLAVACGLFLLVVPGIIFGVGLYVAVPALIAEPGSGATEALGRSWELTRGRRLQVFAVALVLLIVLFVGTSLLAIPVGFSAAGTGQIHTGYLLLARIGGTVVSGLFFSAPAVVYHDLRVEKEGVGTETLAAVFD